MMDDDDVTANAYKLISAQLNSFTSPNVGISRDSEEQQQQQQPYKYERDALDYWNRELIDSAPDDEDDDDASPSTTMRLRLPAARSPTTTPARSMVERAATPVMSNSSSHKKKGAVSIRIAGTRLGDDDDDDDDDMPLPVESPWMPADSTPVPVQTPATSRQFRTTSASSASSTPRAISPFRNAQYEYRRYHDAMLSFFIDRRKLSERIAMDQQERNMQMDTADNNPGMAMVDLTTLGSGGVDPALVREERMVEMEFLRALKIIAWERDARTSSASSAVAVRREGNFWALLQELRKLGVAALLWADDDASQRQHAQTQTAYFEEKASQAVYSSPKELADQALALTDDSNMVSSSVPLRLQRRRHLLLWMEQCFDPLLTTETKAAVSSGMSGLAKMNQHDGTGVVDPKVMRACLSLLLAGRFDAAQQLLRNAGEILLAASWGGGAPAGFSKVVNEHEQTVQRVPVGNVHRPLWKRNMWKLSQTANAAVPASTHPTDEAAITAILAGDYQSALRHPSLRTWEKGLYVVAHALWDRTKEELWHLHNNQRRQQVRAPFPGTQYTQLERDQLQATSMLASGTETTVLNLLSASPFEPMQGHDIMCEAMAAVMIGRTAITDFLNAETDFLLDLDEKYTGISEEEAMQQLRFMTHWLLYLDSMSACSTPVFLEGVKECKERLLFCYVDHLASHEDLWPLVVLYASLLETGLLLDYFPKVLARVQGDTQRENMLAQARELLPGVGMDLVLLRSTIQFILTEEDEDGPEEADTDTPTRADVRKMKSLRWLSMHEEHYGDAVMAANQLLRTFLLANKIASAIMFLQDFLPLVVVDSVITNKIEPPEIDVVDEPGKEAILYLARLAEARSEHQSFKSFLRAYRSVEEWRLVLSSTPVAQSLVDDQVDTAALNDREKGIATAMERRGLIKEKRKVSDMVVQAATTARNNLMAVLEHRGGWLSIDDDVADGVAMKTNPFGNDPDAKRREEILALRSKLLPQTVSLFHQVCDETAAWMSQSLENAVPALGSSAKDALEALVDDPEVDLLTFPLSPKYWTREALELAETIVADEHDIMRALEAADLKESLEVFAGIALKDLMYTV